MAAVETSTEPSASAAEATQQPGLTFTEIVARTPTNPYGLEETLQKVLRSELQRGRVSFDGLVFRLRREAWPADLLKALERLALDD